MLTWLSFVSTTASAGEFFVSSDGSSSGDGSLGNPWDLPTAFQHPSAVKPGDTIWLRGGNYFSASGITPAGTFSNGVFVCDLIGTSNAPIVMRQYPGEHAVIHGGIYGGGAFYWLWGFEITNTDPNRDVPNQFARSWGVFLTGRGCRLINLVVHDCGHPGIGFWDGVGDGGEVSGCIVWGNGFYDHSFIPTNIRGGGIYGQNQFGTRRIRDNIFFKQFTQGIHLYATATYVNGFQVEGNVFFNNGDGTTYNLFLGTIQQPMERHIVADNVAYFSPGSRATNVRLGYEAINNLPVSITGNLIVGGDTGLFIGETQAGVVLNNSIIGARDRAAQLSRAGGLTAFNFNWNHNEYSTPSAKPFIPSEAIGLLDYPAWRTNTGFDAASSFTTGPPAGVRAVVRPNPYEPGRAHITVLNWTTQSTVNVDIAAAGLALGAGYEIHDVQNLFAPPLLTGSYDGTPVALPMNLTAATPLVGNVTHISGAHTGPDFNSFLLLPTTPNNKIVLLSEGFEGAFAGNWTVGDSNPDGTNAYWASVNAAFGGEGAHGGRNKGYCAGVGFDGTAGQATYRDSMTAFMQQSLDLAGFTNATLSFWYRIPSFESCCDSAAVYLDGTPVWSHSALNASWQQASVVLDSFLGARHTLRFEFASDDSVTGEGWYLDDILVSGFLRTNRFIVINSADSGPGSLRQAILDANAGGGGFVTFSIAGSGPRVIQLASPLPALAAPIRLDGRTQPGYTGVPLVHLDGGLVNGDGLTITASHCAVQGLVVRRFAAGSGIALRTGGNNLIQYNSIGADPAGSAPAGNGLFGILIDHSSNNRIGGETAAAGNIVAFNGNDGIRVLSGINNRISANAVFSNSFSGINLGRAPNDPGDTDSGPNNVQNHPIITSANSVGRLTGTLNSAANSDFLLQFFANSACDDGGSGQGEVFLGSLPVSTDASGAASFTFNFGALPGPSLVTATATDAAGSTSEFSPCFKIKEVPVVTIATASSIAAEPAQPGTFTVTRTGTNSAELTVHYTVAGTAGNGVDYAPLPGSVTIPPGSASATVTVAPLDDAIAEPAETVVLTLLTDSEYVLGEPRSATLLILDDDTVPTLIVNNVTLDEGNDGTNNALFTVTLSRPVAKFVAVRFATSDGTATAGSDYLTNAGLLVFAPGITSRTLNVPILGDADFEGDETFFLNLSSPINAAIAVSPGVAIIRNDDLPPATPDLAAALQLDGVAGFMNVPDSPGVRFTNTFSVEAWINRATTGEQHSIAEKYGCPGATPNVGGYAFRVGADDKLTLWTLDDCNSGDAAIGTTSLEANTWYHVAGVWDGAEILVYVNGVLDGVTFTGHGPQPGDTPLKIGERGNGGTGFNGVIDEVRLWSVARTPAQIDANMHRVLLAGQPGLAGYWRFDHGAGLLATDFSGSGNTGTLSNGAFRVVSTAPLTAPLDPITEPATAVTATTAILHGSVLCDGEPAGVFFQWGHSPALDAATPLQVFGAGSNIVDVARALDGLAAGAKYYYRVVAFTLAAGTNRGELVSFTTPGPPAAATEPASNVSGTSAVLGGTVNPNAAATSVLFEWGPSTAYNNSTAPQLIGSGPGDLGVTAVLAGLVPGKTYYYRLKAFNSEGTNYGSDAVFTTFAPPQVATLAADNVLFDGVTLNAMVNPNGSATAVYFEWGTTTNYGNTTIAQNIGGGSSDVDVDSALTGLAFNLTYYFRVVATSRGGASQGAGRMFSTRLSPPPAANFSAHPLTGAAPLSVNFSNLTAGAAGSFAWTFGDGTFSSEAHPVKTYANAGLYTVSLTAFSPGGTNVVVLTDLITVTNPPASAGTEFSASPTSGEAPLTVQFTNLSTGGATNFLWDFGDGASSRAAHPARTYTNAGTYSVTLTAFGPDGTNSLSKPGYIAVRLASPIQAWALRLDGLNGHVSVPDSPALRLAGPITIEALIRRSVMGAQHSILEKYDCTGLGGFALRVGEDDNLHFATRTDCAGETAAAVGATRLLSNTWYHVAGVFDGSQIRVYVNGRLDGALNTTLNSKPKGSPLKIGARGFDSGTSWAGDIDEVRLWNVARTAAEIRGALSPCPSGQEPGLVGYWRLDDGAGLIASDSTGHGHDGTLINGPVWTASPLSCDSTSELLLPRITLALSDGGCHLQISGAPGTPGVIEISNDLENWSALTTFLNLTGTVEFDDHLNPESARRFYRVRQAP